MSFGISWAACKELEPHHLLYQIGARKCYLAWFLFRRFDIPGVFKGFSRGIITMTQIGCQPDNDGRVLWCDAFVTFDLSGRASFRKSTCTELRRGRSTQPTASAIDPLSKSMLWACWAPGSPNILFPHHWVQVVYSLYCARDSITRRDLEAEWFGHHIKGHSSFKNWDEQPYGPCFLEATRHRCSDMQKFVVNMHGFLISLCYFKAKLKFLIFQV